MKKKLITIVMGMVFWAGLFGGCGQTEVKQDNAITNSSEEGKEEGTAEEKELTGTIDEIKDFMFVVTDENDTPYSFTFEEKPEGLENVSNGDAVTVKYTGTISEVDPFEGEVLSVEIKSDELEKDDLEILEDMIKIATNDALKQIEKEVNNKLGSQAGALGGLL